MKTRPSRIVPVTNQIPRLMSSAAMGAKSLQRMKTGFTNLRFFAVLCCTFATTAVFAQSTFVWTNNNVADLATAASWSPNGTPSPNNGTTPGDTMQFDGKSSGPVSATSNTGGQTGFSSTGDIGLIAYIDSNQVNAVNFYTTVASGNSSGIRMKRIYIDNGAGPFSLGSTGLTNSLDVVWGGNFGAQIILFSNSSAYTATIYPNVKNRAGGGNPHTYTFDGTGNWNVTNDLVTANNNNTAMAITLQGSGQVDWTAGHVQWTPGTQPIGTPLTLANGLCTLVLHSAGLLPSTGLNIANNGALLKYDASAQSQTIAGTVSGAGTLQVNNGTLTLSGANTYTGTNVLSGGELIANRAENPGISGPLGTGGANTISFTGGTLGFSANNTYDYSPRFDMSASQAVRIDTAGQNVTLTNALTSSGGTLTKLGSGTLTLGGINTYNGNTTISAGKLLIQGSQGSGNITVANSATLGVTGGGAQVTPGTLAVGTSSSAILEFNNVVSTTTPMLIAGTITTGGAITVNINSGTFNTIGQSFPLFSWAGGTAPTVTLGSLTGAGGHLTTIGSTNYLVIDSLAFIWTGLTDGNWDTTTANDWKLNGSSVLFQNGGTALFDDTSTGQTNVTVNAAVSPASVTVNSTTHPYSITSAGANLIGGTGSLTKSGNGTLTLAGGVNTYSGVTAINGGTVTVGTLANGGTASDIGSSGSGAASLVLNGGGLQYTGTGASIDRLFTLGTAGGTIDASGVGALVLNNASKIVLNGTGARTLTLAGTDASGDTLASVLSDNGGATALTKSGSGTWAVIGNNTNSGTVSILGGTLQVGNGGATGSLGSGSVVNNAALVFNTTSSVTNATISGTGSVDQEGTGTLVLPGDNTYTGGTTINNGTLQVGNGGATGSLKSDRAIVNNGLLIFNSSGSFSYGGNGLISGGGNVIIKGGGLVAATGANSYSGWTEIDPGSTFQPCQGNQGQLLSSEVTNNGTLLLLRQDFNPPVFVYSGPVVGTGRLIKDVNNINSGEVQLTGECTYTGGTLIGGGGLFIGGGNTSGSIIGDVVFTNCTQGPYDDVRTLEFNRTDDITFPGNITGPGGTLTGGTVNNAGRLIQDGTGTLTLTGTNTYLAGTTINFGRLQVGNGGASGAIGTGVVTNNAALIFNRSSALTFGGLISGTGSLAQNGTGILTLTATNVYTGDTSVSNGTLVVTGGSLAGNVNVEGGAFAPASLSAGGQLNVTGNVTIDSGTILAPLNRSLTVTNIVTTGTITRTGGNLVVTNAGSALQVGDKFYIFSQPVSGMTVSGAGATWTNNLAVDGSITALTVPVTINTNRPVLQVSVSGSTLSLGWPTNLGWTLLTNSVGLTATNAWFPYPGSAGLTNVNIIINPAKNNVFFRMAYPYP